MSAASFTAAVVGRSPMAALLAGLLAMAPGQSLCLVADRYSPLRLDRGIALSAAPVTRPETWALLARTKREAARLIARIAGRRALIRTEALFVAHAAAGSALGHMRHMAAGFGIEVEPVPRPSVPGAISGIRFNDVMMLDHIAFMAAVEAWLAALSVRRLYRDTVEMTLEVDGSLRLRAGTADLSAAHAVLADDRAILELVGPAGLAGLEAETQTALLTEPMARRLPEPVVLHVDRRATLWQARGGAIGAILPGSSQEAAAEFARLIGGDRTLHRAGQASFSALLSGDGAPVIGRLDGRGPTIVAGLEPFAVFLAPALARMILGKAAEEDSAWFSAHRPGGERKGVADYAPPFEEPAA